MTSSPSGRFVLRTPPALHGPAAALTRSTYRKADEASLSWEGHPVQVQIVRMPDAGQVTGGLWPEIALDGIVLFERDYAPSRALVGIRRAIAGGRGGRRQGR